jgi:hypothetical protein
LDPRLVDALLFSRVSDKTPMSKAEEEMDVVVADETGEADASAAAKKKVRGVGIACLVRAQFACLRRCLLLARLAESLYLLHTTGPPVLCHPGGPLRRRLTDPYRPMPPTTAISCPEQKKKKKKAAGEGEKRCFQMAMMPARR